MAAIDATGLRKAMEMGNVTPKQLAGQVGVTLSYVTDMLSGRRTLKRNPELRMRIAKALNVPRHWIEHTESAA